MSAIARFFLAQGHHIFGYDKTATALTSKLIEEGMEISFEDDPSTLPQTLTKDNCQVIYTPAIPQTNRIMSWFTRKEFDIKKRAEILGDISNQMRGLAVAGTHGKTTTSCILAHLLTHTGKGCNAFIGGIASNYDSNVLLDESSEFCVIEADEFDRSFHRLRPDMAIITNVEPDHLDIYGSEEEFKKAFVQFAEGIVEGGTLVVHESIDDFVLTGVKTIRYGTAKTADVRAEHIHVSEGTFQFELVCGGQSHGEYTMPLPGRHNISNALAALTVCMEMGVDTDSLKKALADFKGVKRRFQFHIRTPGLVYIDDYAHHPSEIEACIDSVRELYPGKKVTGIFQPHLFSRTRDFMQDFAESLSALDELILLDIYPARELPIEGVDSRALLAQVSLANKMLCTKEALLPQIQQRDLEILLTLGAGDIDMHIEPISSSLQQTITANRK